MYTHPEQGEELLTLLLNKGKADNFEFYLTDRNSSQHLCEINGLVIKDEQESPVKFKNID